MSERPYVLSIAGFDPSAGAGILADIKTFEQHKVYGLGICTAMTVQTDTDFFSLEWITDHKVIYQLEILLHRYPLACCKIGIIPDLVFLRRLTGILKAANKNIFIVFDPVLRSSSGYAFHESFDEDILDCLQEVDLVTPNFPELQFLLEYCGMDDLLKTTTVLLKGGHSPDKQGIDILYHKGTEEEIDPFTEEVGSKHGSGCILSAAITANLALGMPVSAACLHAKQYTERILNSNDSLLAWHKM